ncbi:MAG: PIN domain-containing protein [Phycisphaerae bacterium]|nr:PIN domain-containing protein [Phycisphaerae bacterium]
MKVFLDTNILLDVLMERRPFFEASARIWSLAEEVRIRGQVSAISYPNVFYIVGRLSGRKAAAKVLQSMRAIFSVVACDERVINQAIEAGFEDFEDAVQFVSAVRVGASCIVTRDPDHFPRTEMPILSPTEFLAAHSLE